MQAPGRQRLQEELHAVQPLLHIAQHSEPKPWGQGGQAGRQVGRQSGRQVGRQAEAGREGGQAGRQVGKAGRLVGREVR